MTPDGDMELVARPAHQQAALALVARPAPPASLPYSPPSDDQPVATRPVSAEPMPERTLGRVRMLVRVLFLTVLSFVLLGGLYVLLIETSAHESLGWDWWFVVTVAGGVVASVICWVAIPRWILKRHRANYLVAWRRPTRQDAKWIAAALALMVAFWFAYWAVIPWTGWEWALPLPWPDDAQVTVFFTWWHAALFAASAVIVAPIVEETFFRGFMLGGLNRVWWLIPSLALSALLFSAVHFNLQVIIPFAVFGLILGVMYIRTKHLIAPALTHASWNLGVTTVLLIEYGVG